MLGEVSSPESLPASPSSFWSHVVSEAPKTKEQLGAPGPAWVDVRDLAEAHVLALEKEQAGGKRFIVSAASFVFQDFSEYAPASAPYTITEPPQLMSQIS